MARTFKNRQEARVWQAAYDPRAPNAGDPAPEFELHDVHGQQSVRLSEFRGRRPVALVFGSFT